MYDMLKQCSARLSRHPAGESAVLPDKTQVRKYEA